MTKGSAAAHWKAPHTSNAQTISRAFRLEVALASREFRTYVPPTFHPRTRHCLCLETPRRRLRDSDPPAFHSGTKIQDRRDDQRAAGNVCRYKRQAASKQENRS